MLNETSMRPILKIDEEDQVNEHSVIDVPSAVTPIGLFSNARYARPGRVLSIAGQSGLVKGRAEQDFEAQTRTIWANIKALVEAAGGKMSHLVAVTIYLRDADKHLVLDKIRADYLEAPYPASTCIAGIQFVLRGTEAKVLSFNWRLVDEPLRSKLESAENEPVLQVDRLRSNGGKAMLHTCAHVPAWIGAKLDKDALTERTMLDILMMSGVTISSAEQIMRAVPCPAPIAPLIELSSGDPVFQIERLVRDDRRRPIQHLVATFRWDCFSCRISSTRSEAGRVVEIAGAGHVASPTAASSPS